MPDKNNDPEKNLGEKTPEDGWGWKWIEIAEDILDFS